MAGGSVGPEHRSGFGWDIHRLDKGGPLRLGGVEIPFSKHLVGHSDADILLHATCDALLGAAALGDIGELFPDTDPAFKGADSRDLLRTVVREVSAQGFVVSHLDATVVAEQPKLSAHKPSLRDSLAALLQISADRVSVKAKTSEGLGAVGEGRAMEAYVMVTIMRESVH